MATAFCKEELNVRGKYPSFASWASDGGERLTPPVTPKENLRRFYAGENVEWIPDAFLDISEISLTCNPDMEAMSVRGGLDAFGVRWDALENGLPAMVRPGNPKLKDIARWRELKFPDPDQWDWEGASELFLKKSRDDHDRAFRVCLTTALFERMIVLMDFENAAIALMEDPENVCEFLDAQTEYGLKLIDKIHEYYHVEHLKISDDWASQKSPFFSEKVMREIFLPRVKRLVDRAHTYGMFVTMHSCGNGVRHIPCMIEAGIGAWQFQESAVDIDEALRVADGRLILEGYWVLPKGMGRQEQEKYIRDIMYRYAVSGRVICSFSDENYQTDARVRKMVYQVGREIAALTAR